MIPNKVVHCKRSKKLERGSSSEMQKLTVLRSASPVETFYREEIPCANASQDAVAYRTDVYMLFNQRRLDRMSLNQLSDWLDNQPSSNGLAQLRSKMSDAQLHQFIKSRYIQSLSELQSWSQYIQSEFNSELHRVQDSNKPDDASAPDPASAPAPAPES